MKHHSFTIVTVLLLAALLPGSVAAQTTVPKSNLQKTVPAAAPVITNGIKLTAKGFVVKEAYLVYDDDGSNVPDSNMVELNQKVNLKIVLTKGFKEINGKVFPGGKEKIVLSNGEVILDSEDLFSAFDAEGVSPADAKYINLKAVITELKDKKNYVTVSFRVWDKKFTGNLITGSYMMHIK